MKKIVIFLCLVVAILFFCSNVFADDCPDNCTQACEKKCGEDIYCLSDCLSNCLSEYLGYYVPKNDSTEVQGKEVAVAGNEEGAKTNVPEEPLLATIEPPCEEEKEKNLEVEVFVGSLSKYIKDNGIPLSEEPVFITGLDLKYTKYLYAKILYARGYREEEINRRLQKLDYVGGITVPYFDWILDVGGIYSDLYDIGANKWLEDEWKLFAELSRKIVFNNTNYLKFYSKSQVVIPADPRSRKATRSELGAKYKLNFQNFNMALIQGLGCMYADDARTNFIAKGSTAVEFGPFLNKHLTLELNADYFFPCPFNSGYEEGAFGGKLSFKF